MTLPGPERKWAWRASAGLSGIAAGAGTLIAPLWILTPIGLAFFFFLLWKKIPGWKEAALCGALFGFATAGAGLLSLLEIAPTSPATSYLSTSIAAGLLWLVPTLALGIATMPAAVLLYIVRKSLFAPLAAVCVLVASDELRMWAWMVITYGPGAALEPHLSITALGYALADSPYLLQLARGGGLLYLTVALALFAAAIACVPDLYTASKLARFRAWGALLFSVIIACIPAFLPTHLYSNLDTIRVAVFSTNVGVAERARTDLVSKLLSGPPPAVILLPEGKSIATIFQGSDETIGVLDRILQGANDTLIIRSEESTGPDGARHNTVFYDSARSGPLAKEYKQFLMPEGEYLPSLSRVFLGWIPGTSLANISPENTLTHGSELVSVPFDGTVFGALLCSEVFSSSLYRKLATEQGAKVLVNLADPEWFRGSHILFDKTIQIAKVHAVQNQAYFLAADNAEPSFIIDPSGRVVAETAWGATDVLLFDLPVPAR